VAERSGDAGCRYCGILPGQDLPRPSYYELRQEVERLRAEVDFWDHFHDEGFPDDPWVLGYVRAEVERLRFPPIRCGECGGELVDRQCVACGTRHGSTR
jgi:hypothetical protein